MKRWPWLVGIGALALVLGQCPKRLSPPPTILPNIRNGSGVPVLVHVGTAAFSVPPRGIELLDLQRVEFSSPGRAYWRYLDAPNLNGDAIAANASYPDVIEWTIGRMFGHDERKIDLVVLPDQSLAVARSGSAPLSPQPSGFPLKPFP